MKSVTRELLARALLLPKGAREELIEALDGSLRGSSPPLDSEDYTEVNRWLDEIIDEADEASLHRRNDADVPEMWRSRYYLRQGYHLGKGGNGAADHWQGGEARHKGATCSSCTKPLHLLWDIDCNDARFRKESPAVFGRLRRLPLYFCLHCANPISYHCSAKRLQVIERGKRESDSSPFSKFPDAFPRQRLVFRKIPAEIENLVLICTTLDDDWLRPRHRAMLAAYFGTSRSAYLPYGVRRSQFGGLPVLQQGDSDITCPNPVCPTHTWGHPLVRNHRYYLMKLLAVIDQDAGLPLEMSGAQIVFHLCWACRTVHGHYQID